MRQLTFIKPGTFEWWDVPVPVISSPGDALVRPVAVARCDLDLYIANGRAPFPGPFAMGHEMVGVVVETGDHVARFRPGDQVVVPFQISCGECDNCRRGWTNACTAVPNRACFGMKPLSGVEFGGAISELLRVPFADHMLVQKPDGVSAEALASAPDNIPDGWRAVAPHLAAYPGAAVLVIGGAAQSVGLYAAMAAVSLGASRVVYADTDPQRLRLAKDVGAEVLELTLAPDMPALGSFPITVDASGEAEALRLAIRSTAPCGVCTSVAIYYEDKVVLPFLRMYGAGITFHTGRVHARREMPDVIGHIHCGHMHPERITSLVVPFSDAADAMADPAPKIVFRNDWT